MNQKQYFVLAGFDFSALPGASSSQIMQAINQLAPLDNIGFIVAQDTEPDIDANPEFIRFVWLDTSTIPPVPKVYDSILDSWGSSPIGSGAITTAMLAARGITGGVPLSLLKGNSAYTDEGKAYYAIRIAANGKDIEAVDLSTFLQSAGLVGLNNIEKTGIGAGKVITSTDGNNAVWGSPSLDTLATNSGSKLGLANITPGTNYYILRTNGAGNVEWCSRASDDLLAALSITLDKISLKDNAADIDNAQYQVPMINGAGALVYQNPVTCYNSGAQLITQGTTPLNAVDHNLGGLPDSFSGFLKCTTAELGFSIGDCIDYKDLKATNGTDDVPYIQLGFTNQKVTVVVANYAGPIVLRKDTRVVAALTPANWRLIVQAQKFNASGVN